LDDALRISFEEMVYWMEESYGIPGPEAYMLLGQMFHIPVVLAVNYLAHGCPLVLMNFEAKLALDLIQEHKVSAFLGVTTMLNWMMAVARSPFAK